MRYHRLGNRFDIHILCTNYNCFAYSNTNYLDSVNEILKKSHAVCIAVSSKVTPASRISDVIHF